MSNKELIWVDKDLAKAYTELGDDVTQLQFVNKILEDKKADITHDIECLDNDLLRFKAFALNYKTAFKKAYDEQAEAIYEIWEDCSEPIDKIDRKTMSMRKEILHISNDVNKLAKQLEGLNTYKIEHLIKLIETYSNMSENDKEILKLILDKE